VKDFYFKGNNDITFDSTRVDERDELEQLLSQLKMLFFTNQGDVLKAISLGLNLERLIFETNYNKYTILNNIKYQTGQFLVYDDSKFDIDYELQFFQAQVRDIALLTVYINGQRYLDVGVK
jgi:hypothetical protein